MYTPNPNAAAELLLSAYRFSNEAMLGRIDIAHAVEDGDVSKDELHTQNLYFEDLELKSKKYTNQYREWCKTATMDDKRIVMRYISTKTHLLGSAMEAYLNIN